MGEMGDYILMSLMLSGALGIIGAISHPVLFDESRSAIGVLCLFALAAPLASLAPAIGDLSALLPDTDGHISSVGGYSEVSAEAFSEGIAEYISEEFSIDPDLILVDVSGFDFGEMRAERVTVALSGAATLADARGIRLSTEELFIKDNGECEVVICFEGKGTDS